MRLLFDTNIILDIALRREPHYKDSATVFKIIDNKAFFGFITATTVTDIYYIARKEKGHSIAIDFITHLIQFIDVIGIDKIIILESLSSKVTDFEDAIQSSASRFNHIDFIITRNIKDFISSEVKAILPGELLNQLQKK